MKFGTQGLTSCNLGQPESQAVSSLSPSPSPGKKQRLQVVFPAILGIPGGPGFGKSRVSRSRRISGQQGPASSITLDLAKKRARWYFAAVPPDRTHWLDAGTQLGPAGRWAMGARWGFHAEYRRESAAPPWLVVTSGDPPFIECISVCGLSSPSSLRVVAGFITGSYASIVPTHFQSPGPAPAFLTPIVPWGPALLLQRLCIPHGVSRVDLVERTLPPR